MSDKERPAEPGAGDEGTARGGFARVAEHLNELYPNRQRPISRQLVHKWHFHRRFNSFPEAIGFKGTGNGGQGRPEFDLGVVTDWYASYRRHRGAQALQETVRRSTIVEQNGTDGSTIAA
jgi:hypothetical protein